MRCQLFLLCCFAMMYGMESDSKKWASYKKPGWQNQDEVSLSVAKEMLLASCYAPDGKSIAGSVGNEVHLWSTTAPYKPIQTFTVPRGMFCAGMAYNSEGSRLAGYQGGLFVWDTVTGQIEHTFEGQSPSSVAYNPLHSAELVAVGADTITFWDVRTEKKVADIPAKMNGCHYYPKGDSLALFNRNYVKVWDIVAQRYRLIIKSEEPINVGGWGTNPVAINHTGNQIAVGSSDDRMIIYDAQTGATTATLNAKGEWLAAHHVGHEALCNDWLSYAPDDQTLLFAIDTPEPSSSAIGFTNPQRKETPHSIKAFKEDWIFSLQYNADASQIEALSGSGILKLWSLAKNDMHTAVALTVLTGSLKNSAHGCVID